MKAVTGQDVGTFKMLSYKRVFFAMLCNMFNFMIFTTGDPCFEPHFINKGYGQLFVGFMFALPTISYILSATILVERFSKNFEKRTTIQIGFFFMALCVFFIGPSYFLHIPKSVAFSISALAIVGLGSGGSVIPIIPEIIEAVDDQFENKE